MIQFKISIHGYFFCPSGNTQHVPHYTPKKVFGVCQINSTPSPSITHLQFASSFNDTAPTSDLFPSLTHLIFGDTFDQPVISLPRTLTHLKFGNSFNLSVNHLPSSIKHISFGRKFMKHAKSLPPQVTHLSFSRSSTKGALNLPLSVVYLEVDHGNPVNFAQYTNLTYLIFTYSFNHPVDGLLPNSVTVLMFGYLFNQPVNNLPPKLTHLNFIGLFNQPIDKIPQSIQYLAVSYSFKYPFVLPPNLKQFRSGTKLPPFNLPKSITHLRVYNIHHITDYLPHSLTHLNLTIDAGNLTPTSFPDTLTYLRCMSLSKQLTFPPLPPGLIHLNLIDILPNSILEFPASLKYLHLSYRDNSEDFSASIPPLPNQLVLLSIALPWKIVNLPSSITHLQIANNTVITTPLPSTITHLCISEILPYDITPFLPLTLKSIQLNRSYKYPLDGLPDSIEELNIASPNNDMKFTKLPASLKNIGITDKGRQLLPKDLPPHIRIGRLARRAFFPEIQFWWHKVKSEMFDAI